MSRKQVKSVPKPKKEVTMKDMVNFVTELSKLKFPSPTKHVEGCTPDCIVIGNTGFIAHRLGCPNLKSQSDEKEKEKEKLDL